MTITKVKNQVDKVHIEYEVEANGETDEYSITCSQRAKPEFYLALNDLADHALDICGLPSAWAEGLSVTGVSFSWTDGIMGATICLKKQLIDCDAPLFINTPHMASEQYSPTGNSKLLPDETVEALQKVLDEAKEYVRGNRAQMSLFADTKAAGVPA